MSSIELFKWRCCSETWTIMYQTVRRHSTEDSIVYCYRCHDIASHTKCRSHRVCSLRRHFSEHKVESWGGFEIWLLVQGRGANQRRKSEETLLFLSCGILEWCCVWWRCRLPIQYILLTVFAPLPLPPISKACTFQFPSLFSLRTDGNSNINRRNVAAQFVIQKAKRH
jgi:hypothetical protein